MIFRLVLGPHTVYEFGQNAADEAGSTGSTSEAPTISRTPLVLGGLTLAALGLWALVNSSSDETLEYNDGE